MTVEFDQVASNSWNTHPHMKVTVTVAKATGRDSGKSREILIGTVGGFKAWLTEAPCCKVSYRKTK